MRASVVLLTCLMVDAAANTSSDAVDLLSVAGGAVGAVLEAASQPTCSLILLSDGTASPSTIFKVLSTWRGCPWGAGVLEARADGLDPNRTSTFLSQLVLQARRVRLGSWCVWVVVVSLDTTFLAAFAERSLKGRLLAWGTKLLVVTRLPLTQLHALLSSHWTFSMMAAIFLNLEPTFNHLRLGLYSHLPYGREGAQVVRVATWEAKNGLVRHSHYPLFPDKFSNFNGARVNVTALPFLPFWGEGEVGGVKEYTGSDYQLLAAVAATLNFTMMVLPSDSWVQVVSQVVDRVSFMASVYHILLPQRQEQYDFTFTYEYAYFSFAMAKPSLQPQWQSVYLPLATEVWAAVLGVVILVPPILFWLRRVGDHADGRDASGVAHDVGREASGFAHEAARDASGVEHGAGRDASGVAHDVVGLLVGQSLPPRLPKATSSRILLAVWLAFSIIFGTAYRGNLTAFLTLPKYPPRAETLQQLVAAADRVTMPPYGEEFQRFFKQSDSVVFKALAEVMHFNPSVTQGLQAATRKRQAYMGGRRYLQQKVAELFTEADGSTTLYLGRESIFPGPSGWPIPHNAPYKQHLDRCIMAALEAGLYDKWSDDMLAQARQESRRREHLVQQQKQKAAGQEPRSGSSLRALTTTHLQGAFMLLLLGLALAGLCFVLEVLTLIVHCDRG
ncbi:ionotropic receptor 21a isoform X1 [Procambarus clarkii]|uniref:ionotropic receptor 21a isoform X1 n=1 Tax=Procambarus clarkii TaxID=6728 RepID=UPI00374479CD